ncbi:vacuolar protein sorting [Xylariomycetidae sp. FL2044]|nr:vacuolar protein sorting [Xylariomycetidae sp. FL2044]
MRPSAARGPVASPWPALFLLTILLWACSTAYAAPEPKMGVSEFESLPNNLNYFKGSNVVLFQEVYTGTIWRSPDGGATWAKPDGIQHDKAFALIMHEYHSDRAYVLTMGNTHWRTHDKGETWQQFSTKFDTSDFEDALGRWMSFHAGDPDKIMFTAMDCESFLCEELVMYTTDGFDTPAQILRGRTQGCWWAKSSELFTTGKEDLDAQRILCIIRSGFFSTQSENRLVISDNYFQRAGADGVIQEFEPDLRGNAPVDGIVSLVEVKKFLLAAAVSSNSPEMALYVTNNTLQWHRAMFPHDHQLLEESYTVLESTNYSIQIDVKTSRRMSKPMGTLFTSNSDGIYFTRNVEHTNRDSLLYVDFEKVSSIQGVFLVNQVDNWQDVEDGDAAKKVKTKITFDDGRTFESVRTDGEEIHLHSVTELSNVGSVFSSPAPGLIMGNGNQGDYLKGYWESHLYVSDDAGRTWIEGLPGPHKYEFGDQGSILLAIKDSEEADVTEIKYSLNHGQNWTAVELPEGLSVSPWTLTTTQDSSSLKFILTARKGSRDAPTGFYVISIDFEGLHEDTCKEQDMEEWYARLDDDGKPGCIMGHTQGYHRRKKNAACFVKQPFKNPALEGKPCTCTDKDFECDYNFIREGDECKLASPLPAPEGACKNGDADETFIGPSGWRLIPGNDCERADGSQKDKETQWKCSDTAKNPHKGSGEVNNTITPFDGDYDTFEKHYLEVGEQSEHAGDTIIARPLNSVTGQPGDIWITHDHGKSWGKPSILQGEHIYAIMTHPTRKNMAFFLTTGNEVFYTADRGRHFDSFKVPYPIDTSVKNMLPLSFHPDRDDFLIWHGKRCRDQGDGGQDCGLAASVSTDRGEGWSALRRYVRKCEFTGSKAYKFRSMTQIVCLARKREDNDKDDNPLQLLYTDEFPKYELKVAQERVRDFATMSEFIVVATESQTETGESVLKALASIDGQQYADAHFPYNFEVPHKQAYTVLDSSTHAVNLFVATETEPGRRFGSILKSNSNGTSYVLSVPYVNCDDDFYTDFEKMLGLEGVVLVNTVQNPASKADAKKLQTKISHNDGASWAFLPPPNHDVNEKAYSCSSRTGDESCALHIHGYTERVDHRKTYSSEAAVGMMFGFGNVGSSLEGANDADTFMTDDAGLSWKEVKKGSWMWSFGDQGSVVVLAPRGARSKSISYSLDRGDSWEDYEFSDTEVAIADITTLRSGYSRNFLLWGRRDGKLVTVNLDFSGLADRPCEDQKDALKSDYELWSPEHPLQANGCLFGHKNYYLRKKKDRSCYSGDTLQHVHDTEVCACTRQDFECDYNYEMDNHGQCNLVEGLQPLDPAEECKENSEQYEYYEPSGFRKIPLTTCKGGDELDKATTPHACPGHEEEFKKTHGTSGVAIFFAVVIPVGLASAAGWWVYRNWQGKFGQIRLGEQSALDSDSPWVKYPVVAVSAMVAVIGALPLLVGSVWRSASSAFQRMIGGGDSSGRYSWLRGGSQRRFTTRDSFARGRGDYAIVDEDEGELLGDDSDDDA